MGLCPRRLAVQSREMDNGARRRFWQAKQDPGLMSALQSNAELLGRVQKRTPGTIKDWKSCHMPRHVRHSANGACVRRSRQHLESNTGRESVRSREQQLAQGVRGENSNEKQGAHYLGRDNLLERQARGMAILPFSWSLNSSRAFEVWQRGTARIRLVVSLMAADEPPAARDPRQPLSPSLRLAGHHLKYLGYSDLPWADTGSEQPPWLGSTEKPSEQEQPQVPV